MIKAACSGLNLLRLAFKFDKFLQASFGLNLSKSVFKFGSAAIVNLSGKKCVSVILRLSRAANLANLNLGSTWRLNLAAKRIALASRQGIKIGGLSERGIKFEQKRTAKLLVKFGFGKLAVKFSFSKKLA